ncbi:four helix bundle protein [Rubritalea squalenifaciens DSM 18772]|uniref:Four helix bundle protein n=2 Tax=Rubritalea TaxID=361050 RepID=A0A1M6J416_9BACT|nr:four helix bundle protein [Rubritalea squalenifaciens]SHJ41435.1 four helix bundle protein [Rubritalea squalenifaciens DSM 18772]
MEAAKTYRDLKVWERAHAFVLEVYALTKFFPEDEKYGLTSQLRRAAISVPSNIAEGFSRWNNEDKLRFYNIAEASLAEADYQLLLAKDLKYADPVIAHNLAEETKRLLTNFIKSIRQY